MHIMCDLNILFVTLISAEVTSALVTSAEDAYAEVTSALVTSAKDTYAEVTSALVMSAEDTYAEVTSTLVMCAEDYAEVMSATAISIVVLFSAVCKLWCIFSIAVTFSTSVI